LCGKLLAAACKFTAQNVSCTFKCTATSYPTAVFTRVIFASDVNSFDSLSVCQYFLAQKEAKVRDNIAYPVGTELLVSFIALLSDRLHLLILRSMATARPT
jgi:hypothetical protein